MRSPRQRRQQHRPLRFCWYILVPLCVVFALRPLLVGLSKSIHPYPPPSTQPPSSSSSSCSLSLWLIPLNKETIQTQITQLAKDRGGSIFPPHVTVIGNIPCQSDQHAREIANTLQEGLRGFGTVHCVPGPTKSFTVWNQALVVTMEVSEQFLHLIQRSKHLLGMDTAIEFPPPVSMPHLSLFYGLKNSIPEDYPEHPIAPFNALELALWTTNPPTLEGVSNWKEIAVIDLR